MKPNARNENGFSLPELLVAIVISTTIIGVLTASFVLILKTDDATTHRLSVSHSRQLLATYFPMDVQSAGFGANDVAIPPSGTSECPSATNIIRLSGTTASGVTYSAAYCVEPAGSPTNGYDIVRYYKAGSGSTQSTPVAHYVRGNLSSDVKVTRDAATGLVSLHVYDVDSNDWVVSGEPHSTLTNATSPAGTTSVTTLAPAGTTTLAPTTTAVPTPTTTSPTTTSTSAPTTSTTCKNRGNGNGGCS